MQEPMFRLSNLFHLEAFQSLGRGGGDPEAPPHPRVGGILRALALMLLFVALTAGIVLVIQVLWNDLVSPAVGGKRMTFVQALGLKALGLAILF